MLKNEEKQSTKSGALVAFSLVFEIGYTIAIPAVGFSFGGRFLDIHWGTSPLFLLLGIVGSLMLSSYLVYKKVEQLQ
jgi:F0F1-type ATP synthase assembly protein I